MSLNSLDLGGGGNAFSFDTSGDTVTGKIIGIEELQQTDMQTGLPAVWDNGQPKMMVRVELQTEIRDAANPGDDGKRSVYLKGSRKPESKSTLAAALTAVRNASGASTLQVGGVFTLTYVGDGVPSRKGYNAPKQYEASYQAPTVNLDGGIQGGAPVQQSAPQAAPAPAAAPAAAQPPVQAAPATMPGMPDPASMTEEQKVQWFAMQNWANSPAAPPAQPQA